jgi:hypothetical protein
MGLDWVFLYLFFALCSVLGKEMAKVHHLFTLKASIYCTDNLRPEVPEIRAYPSAE